MRRKIELRSVVVGMALAGAVLAGAQSLAAEKTGGMILGIFNPVSPESAKDLGAKAVRILVCCRNREETRLADRLAEYKRLGMTVIITTNRWNGDKRDPLPAAESAEGKESLDRFEAMLRSVGSSIDYVAIDNEPLSDLAQSDLKGRGNGPSAAIEWYRALARRAQAVIKSDAKLSHIKVASPALTGIDREAEGKRVQHESFDAILDWEVNDPNIDAVDMHARVAGTREIQAAVAFMRRKTKKPLIVTEWSQAGAAREWLDRPLDAGFARQWKAGPRMTNREFVKACYDKPVEKAEWDELVAKAPYDAGFMSSSLAAMARNGVAVATYGAQKQYGNTAFDTKQLYATMTVVPGKDGKPQENYLFATWYRKMAQAYEGAAMESEKRK